MRDTDQAKDSDLEYAITCIFTHKYVHSEGRYTSFYLNIEPDQVLSIQEHQRYKLLVDVLWKRFEGQSSYVRFHESEELIQNFSFHSNDVTKRRKIN